MPILKSLDIINKAYNKNFNQLFFSKGYGEVTSNSYQYIIAVYKLQKIQNATITAISKRLGVRKSSVVQMIGSLEKSGYLTRTDTGGDKRSYTLELTPKGFKMMQYEDAFSSDFLQRFSNTLTSEELNRFEKTVDKIASVIEEELLHD